MSPKKTGKSASLDEHPLVALARRAIEAYVREGQVVEPPDPLPEEMRTPAGAFVSLHRQTGELRGCVGSIGPTEENLAEEVIRSAINAATRDPRFLPVTPDELDDLEVKVDVLSPMERISSVDELDIKRYGVLVESGWRRGLLLPDLPGVESVEQQESIARAKAGIGPDEECTLYRFEVQRYK